jgi:hypothetical protein
VSNGSGTISTAYKKHEVIKKRAYGQRIKDVEHGAFTPLSFPLQEEWARKLLHFTKDASTGKKTTIYLHLGGTSSYAS